MSEFTRGLWVVAYREVLRLAHDRARIASSLMMPLLLFGVFGAGFNRSIGDLAPGVDYVHFLFPGIVGQTVFMTSIFAGLSVVWDREFGFLRELLVAPISRAGIVGGKVIGGAGLALVQAFIILLLAPFVHVVITPWLLLKLVPLLALISFSLSSLGILLATRMRSHQGFQMLMQLLIFPLVFLSGVFFPIKNVPSWLSFLSKLNPLTYGVDAIRHAFLDGALDAQAAGAYSLIGVDVFGHPMTLGLDALVMGASGAVLFILAILAFNRQE